MRMMGGGTSIVRMCSNIYIVEHRVTGLIVELIVYSELNISQQYLCITSPTGTKKLLETQLDSSICVRCCLLCAVATKSLFTVALFQSVKKPNPLLVSFLL